MNEADWLTCTSPSEMLGFLGDDADDRRLRLWAVAACRAVAHHCPLPQLEASLEVAERYAEGRAADAERSAARRAAHRAAEGVTDVSPDNAFAWAVYWACDRDVRGSLRACLNQAALVTGRAMQREAFANGADQGRAWTTGKETEFARQAALVRDIFGNPFQKSGAEPDS